MKPFDPTKPCRTRNGKSASLGRTACVKVTFEEGEGL